MQLQIGALIPFAPHCISNISNGEGEPKMIYMLSLIKASWINITNKEQSIFKNDVVQKYSALVHHVT